MAYLVPQKRWTNQHVYHYIDQCGRESLHVMPLFPFPVSNGNNHVYSFNNIIILMSSKEFHYDEFHYKLQKSAKLH